MAVPAAARPSSPLLAADDDVRAAGCETLVDLLRFRAETSPEQVVYRFLPGDTKPAQRITYRALDRRAKGVAARIAETAKRGDRALLLVPPGLDYIAAYFGCLYAGVIAVPAYPPNPRRPDARIPVIVDDCGPSVAITTTARLARLESWRGGSQRVRTLDWMTVDDVPASADSWRDPSVTPDDI